MRVTITCAPSEKPIAVTLTPLSPPFFSLSLSPSLPATVSYFFLIFICYGFSFGDDLRFLCERKKEGKVFNVWFLTEWWISRREKKREMRKSFKDSLKALEADIQFANTLASDYPREYDGVCLQMRLSYSPAAHFFLFLVQWTGCHLAGALGLLRILIYKAYEDGKTTMSIHERKASLREFYGVIFPSLLQLQRGITDVEDKKQKEICAKYKKKDEMDKGKVSEIDLEREEECGICMEINSRVVLPKCNHAMCMKCYRDWRTRSQSCPFCRDSLKRVNSGDLWIYTSSNEIIDLSSITRQNLKRLFMYIDKLPLIVPDPVFVPYEPCYR